jgi:probable HAF family extracellular repeat protein
MRIHIKIKSSLVLAAVAMSLGGCGGGSLDLTPPYQEPPYQEPSYTVQQIHPEFVEGYATALNDDGLVGGRFKDSQGDQFAAVCSATACTKVQMDVLTAVNKLGHATGWDWSGDDYSIGRFYDGVSTRYISGGDGYDVNDNDEIVGTYLSSVDSHGFLWKDGAVTRLPSLGGYYSFANAINNRGTVVGQSDLPPDNLYTVFHAFLYRDGQVLDLDPQGTNDLSAAYDVNNLDVVVGYYLTAGSPKVSVPFFYSDGAMKPLPLPAGALGGKASHINDAGWIVGTSYDTTDEDGAQRGWVFDGRQPYDLNLVIPAADRAKWRITSAQGINASGQVLVLASPVSDPLQHFSLLLTPTARAN